MATINCISTDPVIPRLPQFKFGRPIYAEKDGALMAYFPFETVRYRRLKIAEQMEAITLLITANDGEDFDSIADDFQLTIRNMLSGMAKELYALCEAGEEA